MPIEIVSLVLIFFVLNYNFLFDIFNFYEGHNIPMDKKNKISKLVQQSLDIINNGKKDYKELIAM